MSFLCDKSKNKFYLKIDKELKFIILESQNYTFFPFRNSQRIKFLSEDFKDIHTEILNEINKAKLKNEFINCDIKLEKINSDDKIEFLFDDCIITSKGKLPHNLSCKFYVMIKVLYT